jgi:hypothetical protein
VSGSTALQGLRSFVYLLISVLLGWAVCFWPARLLRPEAGVFWMSVAAGSCLACGIFVILISVLVPSRDSLVVMLLQMMVRFGSLAGVALVVKNRWPQLGVIDFFGWLIVFYLLTLLLEVRLLQPDVIFGKKTSGVSADSDDRTDHL